VSHLGEIVKAGALFVLTALAEIVGCFLSVHPTSAGRTYAAYGGVYITTAMLWLWMAERQGPTRRDLLGAALCVVGSATIVLGSR
jgi:small multidrug resistance family-3 protein